LPTLTLDLKGKALIKIAFPTGFDAYPDPAFKFSPAFKETVVLDRDRLQLEFQFKPTERKDRDCWKRDWA